MRNKFIFLGTAVLIILIAVFFTAADDSDSKARILQHKMPLPEEERLKDSTHLPILMVDTHGAPIPWLNHAGESMDGLNEGLPADTACTVKVISQENTWHITADEPDLSAAATIRIRGNSSLNFDKKSYLLKFMDSDGKSRSHVVMGMSAGSEWVLHGPFLDRTLIRNYLCYSVAGQVMEYAPNVRYCELYLNGTYTGLYLMTEAVTKEEGRINLTEPERGKAITSWLVRWDRDGKGDTPLENFTHYTYQAGISALDLRYPGKNKITPERITYVETEISEIERAIYSTDRSNPAKGYKAYLDTTAFAQYFVLNEFFGNIDAGRFSTFYYKDMRGKVKPCVWDFNNAADNYIDYIYNESGFNMPQSPWFGQLLKDEDFVRAVIYQYRTLRKSVLSDAYLEHFINDTVAYLGDSVDKNYQVWGYVFTAAFGDDVNYLKPYERNYHDYDASVAQLKTWLKARGAWLDAHIDTLLQYCQESKNATQAID